LTLPSCSSTPNPLLLHVSVSPHLRGQWAIVVRTNPSQSPLINTPAQFKIDLLARCPSGHVNELRKARPSSATTPNVSVITAHVVLNPLRAYEMSVGRNVKLPNPLPVSHVNQSVAVLMTQARARIV
jgi:hypothetical protein